MCHCYYNLHHRYTAEQIIYYRYTPIPPDSIFISISRSNSRTFVSTDLPKLVFRKSGIIIITVLALPIKCGELETSQRGLH